jgi:type I restriction enzyme S subunit
MSEQKQNAPKLRFPGFTDPWEQRKLGEVAKIIGGGTPSTSVPEYWGGDIDWYSPTEIGDTVYAVGSRKRITKSGYQACSATMLPAERTILFTSRAGIGDMAILRRSGCTNQGFQSLVVDDRNDTYFIYSMGDSIKKYAERNASGSTFLEISGKQLACMNAMVPSLSEQRQIGSFFRDLDDLITLHQRKRKTHCRMRVWTALFRCLGVLKDVG